MKVDAAQVIRALDRLATDFDRAIEFAFDEMGHAVYQNVAASDEFKRRTGNLHTSIRWRKRSPNVLRIFTDPRVKYASFVNDGTKAHPITARPGKTLRFVADGSTVFRRTVQHPGTKPTRFFDQSVAEAFVEIERVLPRLLQPSIDRFNR